MLGMGCFADADYVMSTPIAVSVAPPPPYPERALSCGRGSSYVDGSWHWGGRAWTWRAGRCVHVRPGHVYIRPYYYGGLYRRGYWARPGSVPPPPPARPE